VEPGRADGRHNVVLADIAVIRALGAAQSRHAEELEAISAALVSGGTQLDSDALGPVGAHFLAALADAVARDARLVALLGERVATASATARATADAYVVTEQGTGDALTGLGV
jgi:hypothetical protein